MYLFLAPAGDSAQRPSAQAKKLYFFPPLGNVRIMV